MLPVNIRNKFADTDDVRVQKLVLAEDQPEYEPLPCLVVRDRACVTVLNPTGVRHVLTEWQPTAEELEALFAGGRVRLLTLTYGQPFQPVELQAVAPDEMLPLETVS